MTPSNYMALLFNPDELVCSGNQYETKVGAQSPSGPYISINPLRDRRLDSNVTSYRNFLIELDKGSLEDQAQAMKLAGVPYSACTHSGGKSLHYVVALDTPLDELTWRLWARTLVQLVTGADPTTTNPSRFTRLPGCVRPDTGQEQKLLYCSETRIPLEQFKTFIEPRIKAPMPNYHAAHSRTMGFKGLMAAHPLTKAFLRGDHPCHQGRNNALYKCARDLKGLGLAFSQVENMLVESAKKTGLPLREIRNTLESVFKK